MKAPYLPMAIFWMLAVAAPFVVTAIALAMLPPGTTGIPCILASMAASTWVSLPISGSSPAASPSATSSALSYCANDFLSDHGLVHGVSRQGALKLYVACAIVLTAAQIAVTALLLSMG